ncbi:LysR family transcriptional regulator [Sedimentitalea todarodis]|uniref:LysR family transcriptional regulator n=1 Tax=Sedimentitalea todarodis TaxID=1631240 RepID=A0ABU3VGM2_9RHOB|nr:LysR family transcriptional regulator [Sedimentitalea todarodis]MDU9005328.1 LysR family transcriptional regulator [Sedimentitalea todarodis]
MTRINLDQISAFLSVVRFGGVNKAARVLNLTQPAVTSRIKNLEESLSKSLFDRGPGGLRLTKHGELFLRYAERFEHLAEMVNKNVVDPEGLEGYLRIGASETITQCWLPDFVTRLHKKFPKLEVEINVDISVNLRAALLDREIDLAILLGPVSEYTVNNVDLPGFELAWYVAANVQPEHSNPSEFLRMPVLTYARNTRPYSELKALLLERVGPDVRMFPSFSLSACFRLVESGIGVAALPKALAKPYTDAGKIREFDPGWVPNPLSFTASYLGDPKSHMIETAARMAFGVATEFDGDQ